MGLKNLFYVPPPRAALLFFLTGVLVPLSEKPETEALGKLLDSGFMVPQDPLISFHGGQGGHVCLQGAKATETAVRDSQSMGKSITLILCGTF